jgi:hypothetical protein
MTEWLSAGQAAALTNTSAAPDAVDWVAAVAASCEYVEGKRADLFIGTPGVFTPGPLIIYGTAMLSNRWYTRMRSPMGASQNVEFGGSEILRQDPDIAKMLGIGTEGKPVFGGARAAELDAIEAQA